MDNDRSSEKKDKKSSFFSLRKSFSGRSASGGQDFDISDAGSVTSGQDLASPFSDRSARRASAPSALMAVDENTSDLGSEIGGSGRPKKSKLFSTKFVKNMFKSGSVKGSDAGGDIGSPDGVSVADEDEAQDESRMSDASGATGTVDEHGIPKKKKRFSMKAVKKIFRSNSMGSAGGVDAPSVQESASVADGSEANPSPPQSRRKSIFSFGKKSAPPSTESKGIANLSISSKEPMDPYQGPISPTFLGRKPFQDDESEFALEETTSKMPPGDTLMKDQTNDISPQRTPLNRSPEHLHDAGARYEAAPVSSVLNSSGSGSAWKLFQAVEEDEQKGDVSESAVSPGKLEYDLPLQNAGEGTFVEPAEEVVGDTEANMYAGDRLDSLEEPFALLGSSSKLTNRDDIENETESEQNGSTVEIEEKQGNPQEDIQQCVPVFELTIPDSDVPSTPPSSPPQSRGSKHLSASTLSADDAIYSPTVTSPQPLYAQDASELESVSSYGKQKKSSMFSTKAITKLWRRASVSSPKSPVPLPPEDSSVSTQSLASSSRSPMSKPPSSQKPFQAQTPTAGNARHPSEQQPQNQSTVESAASITPAISDAPQSSEVDDMAQSILVSPTRSPVAALTPDTNIGGQRSPSPVPKRGSLSPLKSLSSMLRNSVSPKRGSSKTPTKDAALTVSEDAIAALQEMAPQTPASSVQQVEAHTHEYFEAAPVALDLPAMPSPVKRNTSPKPFARTRSPEKFIFDITHAVGMASKMFSVPEAPASSEPPKSAFVVEASKFANGTANDPSVLKINVPSKSESEVAALMIPSSADVPVTVLILRNTGIISPERFSFHLRFPFLTDLDLGWNGIAGAVKGLPPTLQRLDLSHNRITNISSILSCIDLKELNLSHNNIKSFHGLPATLERLDLSHNAIQAAITLRTLALSPVIKSLDLTGNTVILEVVEWKILLRNMLTHLEELNGRPLPRPKKAGVVPPLGGRRPSPSKARPSATVREEQRVNDAVRTRMHKMKLDMLKESKEQAEKNATFKSKTLKPDEVDHLARRLSAPTKALTLKAKADPVPPPLFSSRDLAHRKSAQPIPSVVAQHTRTADVSLTDFVTRSKLQITKAAQLIVRVTQLSNQDVIDRDDIIKLSNALSRLELFNNRDVPLKVEYAIEKLVDGDALKRRVNTVREQMDVVGLLLQQVDSAMLLSAQGAFTLRDALDSAMCSGPGIVTHTSILRSYETSFDPSSFLGVRTTNPRASWQATEIQQNPAVQEDHYYYGGTVREAQEEFNYRVKDADSRHATPVRAVQNSSAHFTPATVIGYDENKSEALSIVPAGVAPAAAAVTSEAFMDRVRSRISMRAFYGSAEAAEEAKVASPVRMTSYVSLVQSMEDDVPPSPPVLDSPKVAETKVVDSKVAAKDRVRAKMVSRSSSLSNIDTEVPPPPPPEVPEPPYAAASEVADELNQARERDSDIPTEIYFSAEPESSLLDVSPVDNAADEDDQRVVKEVAEDPLQSASFDVGRYGEEVQQEKEASALPAYEGTNDYLDEQISPLVVEDEQGIIDNQDEYDCATSALEEPLTVVPQNSQPKADIYGRSPRSASYYSATPASIDDHSLDIFSKTEEDEQWRAAQLYAEAEAARASPVVNDDVDVSSGVVSAALTGNRTSSGIAAIGMDEEEISTSDTRSDGREWSAPVETVARVAEVDADSKSVSHDFLVPSPDESVHVSEAHHQEQREPLEALTVPQAEPDADTEVQTYASTVFTPPSGESLHPESAASPTLSDTTVDSSKMSAKDRILARMAKNKKST